FAFEKSASSRYIGQDYDIIIIDTSAAGCVFAARLPEDPNISILVLGAGGNRNDYERVYYPG
ncbi:hypothetical protein DOTSEDRAFT_102800, partial [Dothistroma septosporum NZE10]